MRYGHDADVMEREPGRPYLPEAPMGSVNNWIHQRLIENEISCIAYGLSDMARAI